MLVGPPLGETRKVIEYVLRVRVKDVRPVAVHQHAIFIQMVVGVAAHMRAPVDEQHGLAERTGQPFGNHAARIPGAHNQKIEHSAFLYSRSKFG